MGYEPVPKPVQARLAEIIAGLLAGDDVDQAVAKIIARQWREAEEAGKQRRPRLPAGHSRVRGYVGGRRVDAAIPTEVVEEAEVVDG